MYSEKTNGLAGQPYLTPACMRNGLEKSRPTKTRAYIPEYIRNKHFRVPGAIPRSSANTRNNLSRGTESYALARSTKQQYNVDLRRWASSRAVARTKQLSST